MSALNMAILNGNNDIAKLLIENGADQKITGGIDSLNLAEKLGKEDIVKLLIKKSPKKCGFCNENIIKNFKKCGNCKKVYYCNQICQIAHWNSGHKNVCKFLSLDDIDGRKSVKKKKSTKNRKQGRKSNKLRRSRKIKSSPKYKRK